MISFFSFAAIKETFVSLIIDHYKKAKSPKKEKKCLNLFFFSHKTDFHPLSVVLTGCTTFLTSAVYLSGPLTRTCWLSFKLICGQRVTVLLSDGSNTVEQSSCKYLFSCFCCHLKRSSKRHLFKQAFDSPCTD